MLRTIIDIDVAKCDGCGQCITDCAEGALAIVDGKARLVGDKYCDGLGACLNCPQGALRLIQREADAFDENAVAAARGQGNLVASIPVWPIQLRLMPAGALFLRDADLLLAAHCSAFVLPGIQTDWMAGRIPLIACPKLDPFDELVSRLQAIVKQAKPAGITVLRMHVPCCGGLERLVDKALLAAGSTLPVSVHTVRPGQGMGKMQ